MKLKTIALTGTLLALVSCAGINPLSPKNPSSGDTNSGTNTASTNSSSTNSSSTNTGTNLAGLTLWNKLGSGSEVSNSAYGSNGTINGSTLYTAAKFGNGACPTAGSQASSIQFPASVLAPDHGAVQLWYNKLSNPGFPGHEFHGFINSRFGNDGATVMLTYDSYSGTGFMFNVCFGNGTMADTTVPISLTNGLYHVALVWDRAGISGTSQTIRIYLDGAVIYSNSLTGWGTTSTGNFKVAMNAGTFGGTNPAYAVDNLKVFNYAKTNFSDRFTE